jgi:uncharacterized protein (TIGR02001 family)
MKKFVTAVVTALISVAAQAEVTANLGVTSDYRFRGISQTQLDPAIQGGVDYSHKSGAYVGVWASNVAKAFYPGGAGREIDVYAGYRTELAGLGIDVGILRYNYPGTTANFDTNEVYVGASKGPVSLKVSQSITDYFGTANTKNTRYYDLGVSMPTGPVTLLAHAGYTDVANQSTNDYADYSVGVAKEVSGFTVSAKWHTNNLRTAYEATNTVQGERLYKDGFVVAITKAF